MMAAGTSRLFLYVTIIAGGDGGMDAVLRNLNKVWQTVVLLNDIGFSTGEKG